MKGELEGIAVYNLELDLFLRFTKIPLPCRPRIRLHPNAVLRVLSMPREWAANFPHSSSLFLREELCSGKTIDVTFTRRKYGSADKFLID